MVLASLSDWLDGYLARKLKQETELGRLFDPIADKVFIACLSFYFMMMHQAFMALFSLVLFRDVLIIIGGFYIKQKIPHFDLKPMYISKVNTMLILVLLSIMMMVVTIVPQEVPCMLDLLQLPRHIFSSHDTFISHSIDECLKTYRLLKGMTLLLFYGSFITTLWSGFLYARLFVQVYRAP